MRRAIILLTYLATLLPLIAGQEIANLMVSNIPEASNATPYFLVRNSTTGELGWTQTAPGAFTVPSGSGATGGGSILKNPVLTTVCQLTTDNLTKYFLCTDVNPTASEQRVVWVVQNGTATDSTVCLEGKHTAGLRVIVSEIASGYDYIYTRADPTGTQKRFVTIGGNVVQSGLFVSPTGLSTNDGTLASPWDLRSALDGTQTIPSGETIRMLAGTYSDPVDVVDDPGIPPVLLPGNGLLKKWDMNVSNVTLRPHDDPTCASPYPVLVNGGIVVNGADVVVRDIRFENLDPVPGGEPTPPGSDPSGSIDGFSSWGHVGIALVGDRGQVINCVTNGGAGAYSGFQSEQAVWYGNMGQDYGWTGTDREHGHGFYIQNPNPAIAIDFRHNMITTGVKGRTGRGQNAGNFFETGDSVTNLTIEENAFKGPVLVQSHNFGVDNVRFNDNIMISILVTGSTSTDNEGYRWGRSVNNDGAITITDNTILNGRKRLETLAPWASITTSNFRIFKTNAVWYSQALALPAPETGTWIDLTVSGPTTDEFVLWPNAHNPNRAHVVILDLSLDGSVDVDFGGWASTGDRLCIFHYRNFFPPTITTDIASWNGLPVTISLVESADDRGDCFVVFKE